MKIRKTKTEGWARVGAAALLLAVALPVLAQQMAPVSSGAAAAQVNPAYDQATAALDRANYDDAIALFRQVIDAKGARADAATYWIAYAQQRKGNGTAAMETIGVLRRDFPESAWLDDADTRPPVTGGAGTNTRGGAPRADEDEDMRLYALNALMNVEPERALPLLERMVRSDESLELRERALFILMQGGADAALDLVAEVARDDTDPEMRITALRNLGMFGGDRASSLMNEIYAETTDVEVKEAIISGFMMSGDTARLYELARTEPGEELRMAALRHLAMAGGVDEIWALYEAETSIEVREAILQTIFMTGDQARVLQVALTETEPRLRRAAIRSLGMMGDDDGGGADITDELLQLYRSSDDMESREAILNALWMRGQAQPLIALYEETSDPDLQRRIVQALSMVEDEAAVDFLIRLIEQ
jgi:HEAT repeat protein